MSETSTDHHDRPGAAVGADRVWDDLGNFTARIVADRKRVDGAGGAEVTFELEVRVAGGPPEYGTIPAADFDLDLKLRAALRTIGRTRLRLASKRHTIAKVRQAILGETEVSATTEYTHTGWTVIDGADHFLMPGHSVGPTEPVVDLVGGAAATGLAGYGFVALTKPEFEQALVLLRDGLLRAMPPRIAYPAVAHAFLGPLARWLPTPDRYALFLRGRTGVYKTTYARLTMGLWGAAFVRGPVPASWTGTVNAIEALGFRAKDALVLVDDYKPGTVDANQVTRLFQNYADGTGRNRLDSGAAYRGGYPIRGHLLATGEDAPQGEASVRARLLVLDVERGDADLALITRLQERPRLLAGLMPRFVAWLMGTPAATARVETLYAARRDKFLNRLGAGMAPNPGRIAQNLAMNAAAFDALVEWLADAGAIAAPEAAALEDEYGTVVDHLLAGAARGVQAQNAGALFLERVSSLVASSRCTIAGTPQEERDPHRIDLGWRDGGVVYLTTIAFDDEVLGDSWPGVSSEAIRKHLAEDGILVGRDDGQLTVRKARLGQQFRVTAIRADALGFGDPNAAGTEAGANHTGRVQALPRTGAGERAA